MHLLLTNDDGADSPALVPFARALARLGSMTVSVPDRERSWIGKAITRFEPVTVAVREADGVTLHACSGFPADAAQLGIHVLGPTPELVVSGINIGHNHGAGFLMSSGTVGAAVEGWISGVRAIAFSTGIWSEDYEGWRRWCVTPEAQPAWQRLADTCVTILQDLLATDLLELADVVSVNLPFDATPDTPRRLTSIARTGYGQLFHAEGDGVYVHQFSGVVEFDALDGTDVGAARDGLVSITGVRLPTAIDAPDSLRAQVERS